MNVVLLRSRALIYTCQELIHIFNDELPKESKAYNPRPGLPLPDFMGVVEETVSDSDLAI